MIWETTQKVVIMQEEQGKHYGRTSRTIHILTSLQRTEHPTTYYEDMQRAIFCFFLLGWAPWSPRLVEALIFSCIPVIIADDIVLHFAREGCSKFGHGAHLYFPRGHTGKAEDAGKSFNNKASHVVSTTRSTWGCFSSNFKSDFLI